MTTNAFGYGEVGCCVCGHLHPPCECHAIEVRVEGARATEFMCDDCEANLALSLEKRLGDDSGPTDEDSPGTDPTA